MPIDPDYAPGEAAPETGIYELLTMMGSRAGPREHNQAGAPLLPGPLRHDTLPRQRFSPSTHCRPSDLVQRSRIGDSNRPVGEAATATNDISG
jgi:hypothetical protein